jgi:formylglycine-generating enzyme required for sulfatase activity
MVGLANAFLEAGAGAFLGSHWALDDEQAFCFAEELYRNLFAGVEIGEAVAQARSRLRHGFPGSYDWLAYTVFAHPLACCDVSRPETATKTQETKTGKRTKPVSPPPDPEPSEKPAQRVPGEERVHPKDGTVLVYVPGGEIVLGDEAQPFSSPLRRVRLSPFWIGKYPVTNEQYARYLAENPAVPKPACWDDPCFNGPRLPVVGVSWEEACAYCQWAGLELPTEAQWEAAARGSDRRPFPWGTGLPTPRHANFGEASGGPAPVGALLAGMGPYGTLDQAGNVWEWCADPWAADALRRMKDRQWDPVADGDAAVRALRGGSWVDPASALGAGLRQRASAGRRLDNYGFRCVRRLT